MRLLGNILAGAVYAGLFEIVEVFLLHRTLYRVLVGIAFLLVGFALYLWYGRISYSERTSKDFTKDLLSIDLLGGKGPEGRRRAGRPLDYLKPVRRRRDPLVFGAGNSLAGLSALTENCIIKRVFYATDRQPRPDDGGMLGYEGERQEGGSLSFGVCTVTIPAKHRIGSLESPTIWRLEFSYNPSKHVTLVDVEQEEPETFFTNIAQTMKASERKEAFVFVHGYNVAFEDAARRTAQIAEDLKFDGAAIFYSWPSKAAVSAYPVDETNVRWTVPHLRAFLAQLAETVGVSTIHLIGHSMGNRALTDVLESWDQNQEATFKHVVLTAPDIDADTFRELAAAIRPSAQRLTMYASERDKALILSKQFHGYTRAGETVVIVNGLDTIDASAVDTSFLGHSYASENRSVLQDIYALLTSNAPPEKRFGMTRKERPEGIYYVFHP